MKTDKWGLNLNDKFMEHKTKMSGRQMIKRVFVYNAGNSK